VSELHDVDRRVAVLEQIARDTATALADIRAELRLLRTDIQQLRGQFHDDFRWLLRFVIGGFVGCLPCSLTDCTGFRCAMTEKENPTPETLQAEEIVQSADVLRVALDDPATVWPRSIATVSTSSLIPLPLQSPPRSSSHRLILRRLKSAMVSSASRAERPRSTR
jgi:hypothetical protein